MERAGVVGKVRTVTDLQTSLSALLRWSRAVGGMTRLRAKPAGQAGHPLGREGQQGQDNNDGEGCTLAAAPAVVAWQLLGWPFVAACLEVLVVQNVPAAALASMARCLSTAPQTAPSIHSNILSHMVGQSKQPKCMDHRRGGDCRGGGR